MATKKELTIILRMSDGNDISIPVTPGTNHAELLEHIEKLTCKSVTFRTTETTETTNYKTYESYEIR